MKERKKTEKMNFSDQWDNNKQLTIHAIGVQGGGRKGGREEIFFKIMADHLPDLIKTINAHIQEAQQRR